MYLIYTIDAQNPRFPSERVVHCVDTDLADRFFVKSSTQGERTMKKLVDELDDFIGDQRKDLTKPLQLIGIDADSMGTKLIADIIRRQPLYVDVYHATANKLFRRA